MKKEIISQKRKEDICATLKDMMKRKSIQKITIQELADECGISRYTFYYHFTDIYDCLSHLLQEELRRHLRPDKATSNLDDLFLPFLQSIQENRATYKHLLSSPRPDLLHSVFHQELQPVLRVYLIQALAQRGYQANEEYLSFLTDFYSSSIESASLFWLQQDPGTSQDTYLDYLHTITDGRFESMLQCAKEQGLCTPLTAKNQEKDWNYLL